MEWPKFQGIGQRANTLTHVRAGADPKTLSRKVWTLPLAFPPKAQCEVIGSGRSSGSPHPRCLPIRKLSDSGHYPEHFQGGSQQRGLLRTLTGFPIIPLLKGTVAEAKVGRVLKMLLLNL